MARKSKAVSASRQRNLFEIQDESPNSETIEQAIAGPQTPVEIVESQMEQTVPEPATPRTLQTSTPPMREVRCPQCGGPAALSMRESGKYYCQGACSYGDNFYFNA